MGTAIIFINLEGTVVETALGIASYTYGGLLGIFLLGLFYRKAGQKDAIIGFIVALMTMTILIQSIDLAWPLYTVTGSLTTLTIGIISSILFDTKAGTTHEQ